MYLDFALASAGLFLIMLNGIYTGGLVFIKNTPASIAAAAVVFFVNDL